jgi:hypothetical protein
VEKEGLPREQPVLHLLLRMLALGLSAWEMIETQDFRDSVAHLTEISASKDKTSAKKTSLPEKGAEIFFINCTNSVYLFLLLISCVSL